MLLNGRDALGLKKKMRFSRALAHTLKHKSLDSTSGNGTEEIFMRVFAQQKKKRHAFQ
jgi:hypothetical protein